MHEVETVQGQNMVNNNYVPTLSCILEYALRAPLCIRKRRPKNLLL